MREHGILAGNPEEMLDSLIEKKKKGLVMSLIDREKH